MQTRIGLPLVVLAAVVAAILFFALDRDGPSPAPKPESAGGGTVREAEPGGEEKARK